MEISIVAAIVASSLGLLGVGVSQIVAVLLSRSNRKEAHKDKVRETLLEVITNAHQLNTLQQGFMLSIVAHEGNEPADFLNMWIETDSGKEESKVRHDFIKAVQRSTLLLPDGEIKKALRVVKDDYEKYFEDVAQPVLDTMKTRASREEILKPYAASHLKLVKVKSHIFALEEVCHSKLQVDIK